MGFWKRYSHQIFVLLLSVLINGLCLALIQIIFLKVDSGLDKLKQSRSVVLLENDSGPSGSKKAVNKAYKKAGKSLNQAQSSNSPVNTNAQALIKNEALNTNLIETVKPLSNATVLANSTNGFSPTNTLSNITEPYYFRLGEKISYSVEVEVNEIPAIKGVVGTVEIEVLELTNIRGNESYHCRSTVRSLDAIINLYELKDVFDTWFDSRTLKTYQIEKQVKEGGWLDNITNYLYSDEEYGVIFSKDSPEAGGRYELRRNSFDIITLLYFLRITDKSSLLNLNWIADFGQRKELAIEFNKGEKLSLVLKGKETQVDTVVANEKQTGIKIFLAEGHDYLPVRAVIPAFKVVGYTFNLIATFRHYEPGKAWSEHDPEQGLIQ